MWRVSWVLQNLTSHQAALSSSLLVGRTWTDPFLVFYFIWVSFWMFGCGTLLLFMNGLTSVTFFLSLLDLLWYFRFKLREHFYITVLTSPEFLTLHSSLLCTRLDWRSCIACGTSCCRRPRRRACVCCRPRNLSSTCESVKMLWTGSVTRLDAQQCRFPDRKLCSENCNRGLKFWTCLRPMVSINTNTQ